MKKYNSGNTNTILIVIVLVVIVALGVWWFTMNNKPTQVPQDNVGIVNDSLPTPTTVQTTTTITNTKEENPPPPSPPPVRYVPEQ